MDLFNHMFRTNLIISTCGSERQIWPPDESVTAGKVIIQLNG